MNKKKSLDNNAFDVKKRIWLKYVQVEISDGDPDPVGSGFIFVRGSGSGFRI